MIEVYTADDFKSQWSLLNAYFEVNNIEVDNMEVFCHGNAENLYFKGSNLSVDDVNSLDDFSFSKNAQLILHSCNWSDIIKVQCQNCRKREEERQ